MFSRKGYHAAGVSDIIAEAGVARGTFYNYFESKRSVFQAVLASILAEVTGTAKKIDVTGDVAQQVRANIVGLVVALSDAQVARLLFAEAAAIDDEGNEALREFYGNAIGRVEKALRDGQALGIVRECDVRLGARCLLGVLREPLFQAWLLGERVDTEALVDEMLQILTVGILGR